MQVCPWVLLYLSSYRSWYQQFDRIPVIQSRDFVKRIFICRNIRAFCGKVRLLMSTQTFFANS